MSYPKTASHFIWIILACTFGILLSHMSIQGVHYLYAYVIPEVEPRGYKPAHALIVKKNIPVISRSDSTITIGFVGDIIPGPKNTPGLLNDVVRYTVGPDILIGNFEGVAAQTLYTKCKTDSKKCFSFNGDAHFLSRLRDASFDVLNIANNHFNDYGETGQRETLAEIENMNMIPSGMKNTITYVGRNNIKVGIIGVSNYTWTTNMLSTKTIEKLILEAKQNADIVIAIFHAGGEGAKYDHTPIGTEWYLNENRGDVRAFAHSAIDAGADVVLGSGPHVLRGMEIYADKLIAYSLGNFVSSNSVITSGPAKNSAMLNVTFKKDGSLLSGIVFPFEIDPSGIPHPDINNTSISVINDLSFKDFGSAGIVLEANGNFILK